MTVKSASKKPMAATSDSSSRRTMSIFSRKGYDAPSPVALSVVLPNFESAHISELSSPTKSKNTRSNEWRLRRSLNRSKGSMSAPASKTRLRRSLKGKKASSVLPDNFSAIEMEMATSPNEEILKSIGMSPATESSHPELIFLGPQLEQQLAMTTFAAAVSRSKYSDMGHSQSYTGHTHAHAPCDIFLEQRPKSSIGFEHDRPLSSDSNKLARPKIQVVIPQGSQKLFTPAPFHPTETEGGSSQARPRLHFRSLSDISPPSVRSPESAELFSRSAVSPESANAEAKLKRMMSVRKSVQVHEPEAAAGYNHYLQVPVVTQDSSHDGSSIGSTSEDDISGVRSQRSSITSIDSQPEITQQEYQDKGKGRLFDYDVSPINEANEVAPESTQSPSAPRLGDLIHLVRTPSTQKRPKNRMHSVRSANLQIPGTLPENEEVVHHSRPLSPTLSEAEQSLVAHLETLSPIMSEAVENWLQEELQREFSVKRKPCLPPKSDRRMSRASSVKTVASMASTASIEDVKFQLQSMMDMQPLRNCSLKRSSSVRSVLSLIAEDDERQISSDDAEKVIYLILSHSNDLEDFFAASLINSGFHRVAKRHEFELMNLALYNMSPAAWEYRQVSSSWEDDDSAYSGFDGFDAARLYQEYIRDSDVIGNIKLLILERCQSILRPEIVKLLATVHKPRRVSRIDDALWRIWTFCSVFGGDKAREEDLAAQMDWFRGGAEARQVANAVYAGDKELSSSSSLLFASEYFGKGNETGLSAEALYDITELWNCIRTISQGIIGRTEQARQFGVFDATDVRGGDIDGEEIMLEEWHNSLLTMGLSVVYEISKAATSLYAFSTARRNNWTRWSPPTDGMGRRRFLAEPAARLYEERISSSLAPADPEVVGGERRSVRRRRRESYAAEIKQQKKNQSSEKIPADTEEKMMSRANSVLDYLSSASTTPALPQEEHFRTQDFMPSPTVSPMSSVPSIPSVLVHSPTRAPPLPPTFHRKELSIPTNIPILSSTPSPSLSSSSYGMPVTPPPVPKQSPALMKKPVMYPTLTGPYGFHENVSIMPSSPQLGFCAREASMPAKAQHPLQLALMEESSSVDAGMFSSEKAIFRIVEMGFTAEQAKKALMITDMGDGLRVDRAVEYLLRQ